jgi:predicted signal transduction protein with EAL and GGDEF domain
LIPPNISSETGDGQNPPALEQEPGIGLRALVDRLAEEFGADAAVLVRVASLYEEGRKRAPDIFVPVAGGLAPAFSGAAVAGGAGVEPVYLALGEWALDAEGEPIERMRRDCLRFQGAMTRSALRLYSGDPDRCAECLLALQRFTFLQVALIASLAARSQTEGGVVRTLPTPEYAAFMDIFRKTIETHRQEGKQLGLLVLQVAKVEHVDRVLGLQKGEAFMLRVTRRMREGVLRKQDQLGRVSRDQFACLLPRIAGEGVAILAANKILEALEAPIPLGDRAFDPDAVIGIAMYPDHGADQQTLVRNGKLAAGIARGSAERVAVYDAAHGESEERNMQYETRLRYALEQSALSIGFLPQLDIKTGRIAGLECQLCWTDAELGAVPEARTVDAAESSGLIRELTWWTYNNALRLCAEIAYSGIALPIALKVTANGLAQPDFSEFVERALRTWKVAPERLVIEIHETALVAGIEPLQDMLTRLKALGVRLGIDGFGTASSSLANLAQLPLDEVKIGAAFVSDMQQAPFHARIVRSLAHLAQDLGLAVAAEGVGDAETAAALSALGCSRVQGAYVGQTLSVQEVLACNMGGAGPVQLPVGPEY